ncbi:MAG: FtsX-like permease family protein [Acidimicrobiales bacterium]
MLRSRPPAASSAPRPSLSVLGVVAVLVVVAAGVAALATRRVARTGVAGMAAAIPARPSAAAGRALAAGLPAPVALVAKEVSSSRARAAATVLAVALAVMSSVAALGMEATFRHDRQMAAARSVQSAPVAAEMPALAGSLDVPALAGSLDVPALAGSDESGLRTLVYGLQALLATVAVAGIVAVGLVGFRERRRELAVLSAIGFSVRQLAGSAVAGQGVLAGVGALVGIPLGIGFFRAAYALANGSSAGLVDAPLLHLLAVVPVTMLVAGLVAAVPASALRRLPVSAALTPA